MHGRVADGSCRAVCVLLAAVMLLLCAPLALAGAAPGWQAFAALRGHTVLTGDNGPAVRNAYSVSQDSRGRIWIGTNDGAIRLDGDLVQRYEPAQVPAMATGFTRVFHPLDNGDVLIGGDLEGVLRWQLADDRFVPVTLADGRRLNRINAIEPARDGGAWVAAEQGLFYWDAGSNLLQPVDLDLPRPVDGERIFDVEQTADGTLWVAAAPGLYQRGPGQRQFQPVQVDHPGLQQRLDSALIWQLAGDAQGGLWVGFIQHGVVRIQGRHAQAAQGLDGLEGLHAGNTIRAFVPIAGQMWVAVDGRGLMAIEQMRTRPLAVNLSQFLGGRNFHPSQMIRARDGRIWVASDRGVFHLDPEPAGIVELDASLPGEHAHQQPDMARTLHIDRRGRLWIGNFDGVVQVLDPHSGQRHVIRLPSPLDGTDVVAIAEDSTGQIWVASNGVAVIDPDSLRVRGGGALEQVPVQRYLALAAQGQRVWVGGREGVLELDLEGKVLRRMLDHHHGLRSNRVHNLAVHADALWVGTGEGLHRLDLDTWQARHVPVGSARGDLPANRYIVALLAGREQIHVGTLEGVSSGLPADARLQLLLPAMPGPGRGIANLGEDSTGGLWAGIRDGDLYHRDLQGHWRQFGARHGLHPRTRLRADKMVRSADGSLFMAAGSGVIMLQPGLLQLPEPALPDLQPHIVSMHLDGRPLPPSQLPGDGQRLQLARDVERVALSFSAMDYLAPQRRQYSYRLEGLDSRWISASSHNQVPLVLYSRLPVGQYTLLLRTTSDEYPGKEWITRLQLEVPPAWYQQWWVQLLALLLFLLAVAGAVRWRLHAARKRQRRLQQRVLDSTAELRQANARLAQLVGEDALTGLDNRRRGFERLAELHTWRQRMRGSDCVVLMDLDHFKKINDRHGHLGGDAVLRAVGQLLRSQLRAIDIAARYGGEELLLVLVDADLAQGQATVERIRAALQDMVVDHDGQQIAVSASFGMALSDPTQPVERWIERADAALYRAKRAGRGRLCVDATEPPTQVV